jgi:hypothetical protein
MTDTATAIAVLALAYAAASMAACTAVLAVGVLNYRRAATRPESRATTAQHPMTRQSDSPNMPGDYSSRSPKSFGGLGVTFPPAHDYRNHYASNPLRPIGLLV